MWSWRQDSRFIATAIDENTLQTPDGVNFTVHKPLENDCFDDEVGDRRCLPGLVHIGLGHAGSTALFTALSMHPQLEPHLDLLSGREELPHLFQTLFPDDAPLRGSETWFFDKNWNTSWTWEEARSAYAAIFPALPKAGQKMTYEKGPWYWQHLEIPERLGKTVPNAKISILLRDPVTWLHSMFYPLSELRNSHTFATYTEDQISEADTAFVKKLEEWGFKMCHRLPASIRQILEQYPREALLVHLTEEFRVRPVGVLQKIAKALDLTPFKWDLIELNQQRGWQHVTIRPKVSDSQRKLIRDRCRTDFEEIQKILSIESLYDKWDSISLLSLRRNESLSPKRKTRKAFNPVTRKLEDK